MTYEQELLQKVDQLSAEQKRQVLAFVDGLSTEIRGTPGKLAVQIAREIGFSHEDLEQMQQAIGRSL